MLSGNANPTPFIWGPIGNIWKASCEIRKKRCTPKSSMDLGAEIGMSGSLILLGHLAQKAE